MLGKGLSAIGAVALACAPSLAPAANFDVNNPAEFQTALTEAASNGENDVINVGVCSGAGCFTVDQASIYDIVTPLTFTSTEGLSLTIDGLDSDTRILGRDANNANNAGMLFIDTTGASDDFGAEIVVKGITIVGGNNVGDDGGALNIHVNSPRVEVSGSVFEGNAADGNGGALFIRSETGAEFPIQIFDVTFDTNSAGLGGGGVHVAATGDRIVEIFNVSFFTNDAANGGGLQVEGLDPADPVFERVSWVTIDDFDFNDNIARSGNGGGADIAAVDIDVSIGGFVRNTASSGSGAGLYVRRNFFALDIVNTGFAWNVAGIDGGGFAFESNDGATIRFTNNTLFRNESNNRGAGGLLTVGGSTGQAQVYNNIIYGNTGANVIGLDLFVDNDPFSDIPAVVNFFNNNITDMTGFPDASAYFAIASSPELGAGNNIAGDPLLVDITEINPDPMQTQNSPTIDMGDDNAPGVPTVDYQLQSRPAGSAVDIGMDEFVAGALPSVDMSVTKTDSPDPVTGGEDVTYTIVATNNGPDDATNVVITDTLDAQVTFVSATFDQGSPCTTATINNLVVVTCVLGDLAVNDSASGTIVVTSPVVEVTGGIANAVSVSANETDPNAANNTAQQGTTVVPEAGPAQADLAVSKIDTPDPVFSGGPDLTYTITVENNGPDTATGVTVTDTLPAEVSFLSATSSAGQCDAAPDTNGVLACALGDLANGSNATVTLVVEPAIVTEPSTITNSVSVVANEEDPTPGNDSAVESTTVNPPSADMMVTTSSSPASPMINEQVTYTVTVTNDGPSDNTGVVLTVILPPEATFGSVAIEQGSCDVSKATVTCTIGDLAAGASVSATIIVTAPSEPMTLTLSATIVADVADPVVGNNADSEDVTVIDVVDLVIRGTSEGTGSIGWFELLLAGFAGLAAFMSRRRRIVTDKAVKTIGLFAAAFLVLAMPLDETRAEGNWYLGASIGTLDLDYSAADLTQDLASLGWSIDSPSVDDSGTAWKGYGGFAVNDYFAVEAGYADLGKVVTEFGASVAPTQIDAILSDTYSVHPYQGDGWFTAAVLRWPVQPDRFTLVARGGVFWWESDLDVRVVSGGTGNVSGRESGTDTMFGLGLEWRFNEQWSLTADWERYKLNEWLDVPSIGVRFDF